MIERVGVGAPSTNNLAAFAGVPLWAVALAAAAAAPWCVRALVKELERRSRERTVEALARASRREEHDVGGDG
jgi:hypothetical protein